MDAWVSITEFMVPETYLIDKAGVIRYKQIGPLTLRLWRNNPADGQT